MADNNINGAAPKKKKGMIRTEAVVPVLIVAAITYIYFAFIFDHNLKSALEFIGYEVVGAEVDIAKLETNFFNGSFQMQGLEVTNPNKPELDMVKIGEVKFGLLWDGLLRARFVVDEMAVDKIEISVPRHSQGKVKPPEPPPTKKEGPSALEKEGEKAGKTAAKVASQQFQGNVFGDIAAMLGGKGGSDDQVKNIEENLPSKKKLDAFSADLTEKQKKWQEKLKTLPQNQEIQALGQRLSTVKTGNFKNPQEMVENLQKLGEILKDADSKYKSVAGIAGELTTDLNNTNAQFNEINGLVNQDIASLQSRLHIPNIDGKSLSNSILQQYMATYMGKLYHYKTLADKYFPPHSTSAAEVKDKKTDESIQAHPRAKGVSYEFGRQNSYPMFWIKKITVSSKSNPADKMLGDMSGLVTDVSSNQVLAGHPTVGKLDGNFPGLDISGVSGKFVFDNRSVEAITTFDFAVASYPIEGKSLIDSPDAKVAFKSAIGTLKSHGELLGMKQLDFSLDNQISKVNYDISAPNPTIDEILKSVFQGIPVVTIDAQGKGEIPDVSVNVNSNIGGELQKGFQKQISAKVEAAKAKLEAQINQAIGGERAKIQGQLASSQNEINGQVKKIEDALNAQKNKATQETGQAQKGGAGDAQKKLDDLKKSLGF